MAPPEQQSLPSTRLPVAYYRPVWTRSTRLTSVPAFGPEGPPPARLLIVHGPRGGELARRLAARRPGDAIWRFEISTALGASVEALPAMDTVFFLAEDPEDLDRAEALGVRALLRVVQALGARGRLERLRELRIVTRGLHRVDPGDVVRPLGGALPGLARSIATEYPHLAVTCLDLDPAAPLPADWITAARGRSRFGLLAARDGHSHEGGLEPVTLPGTPGGLPAGVYLIVGGTGALGFELALELAKRSGTTIALMSRHDLDDSRRARLVEAGAIGGRIHHFVGDAALPEDVASVVETVRRRFGSLQGVFHAALVLDRHPVATLPEDSLAAVLRPKVRGIVSLRQALEGSDVGCLVVFSSIQSLTGDPGFGAYAAASTFVDAYGASWAQTSRFPVKVVNWGPWERPRGDPAASEHERRLAALGAQAIRPDEGLEALARSIGSDLDRIVAVKGNAAFLESLGAEIEEFEIR